MNDELKSREQIRAEVESLILGLESHGAASEEAAEIEARMLEDVDFAMEVSSCVKDLQLVRTAVRSQSAHDANQIEAEPPSRAINWKPISLVTLAASVFVVAAGMWLLNEPFGQGPRQDAMADVATEWIALMPEEELEQEEAEAGYLLTDFRESPAGEDGSSSSDEDDWMLQAAQEFLLEEGQSEAQS